MRTEKKYSVYGHVNITNGKWYVGMTSREPKERWNYGFGYQRNQHMWEDIQESDWNNDWIHTVFDTFDNREDALDYEAFLVGMFDTIENGYNISSYGNAHYERTEEYKKKMSKALSGENNPNFGKHISEEQKKKISESLSGEKSPWYGKHHSEESKKKMSENRPSKPVLQFTKEGAFLAEYPSACEAQRQTGCIQEDICKCCKGKRKSVGGYIWKYKEG